MKAKTVLSVLYPSTSHRAGPQKTVDGWIPQSEGATESIKKLCKALPVGRDSLTWGERRDVGKSTRNLLPVSH